MKAFAIFAVLCFENPQSDIGMSCVNFWEDPMIYYKNERKCLDASIKKSEIMIKKRFVCSSLL